MPSRKMMWMSTTFVLRKIFQSAWEGQIGYWIYNKRRTYKGENTEWEKQTFKEQKTPFNLYNINKEALENKLASMSLNRPFNWTRLE